MKKCTRINETLWHENVGVFKQFRVSHHVVEVAEDGGALGDEEPVNLEVLQGVVRNPKRHLLVFLIENC
jgi:hypothetical protein